MYCRLLEYAVQKARNEPVTDFFDVSLKLDLESYIPDTYIPEYTLKMDMYRRLNRSRTFEEINKIAQEMTDRFGKIPLAVKNLLLESELKIIAKKSGIQSIIRVDNLVILHVSDIKRSETCLHKLRKYIRVINDNTLHLRIPDDVVEPEKLAEFLKNSIVK